MWPWRYDRPARVLRLFNHSSAPPVPGFTAAVLLQLSSVGVPENCMAFTHVTMQSEKYVCVRETGTTNNVVIIDMSNPSAPMRKPITADSTILAPSSKVLALKAQAPGEGGTQGDNLQVFNLDTKQKVRAYVNPVKVQFWAWISDDTIALVTDSACFHWNINVCSTYLRKRTWPVQKDAMRSKLCAARRACTNVLYVHLHVVCRASRPEASPPR